jgi:hypothetical protein
VSTVIFISVDNRGAITDVSAVLMDLSKAFDCLPHNILLDKLSAYGVSSHSISLLKSYLSNRKVFLKAPYMVPYYLMSL